MDFTDYTDLKVTEEQIQGFSNAIVAFWNDVPNNIHDDDGPNCELPKWFEKAWLKDRAVAPSQSSRTQNS
jgi:hypothetical protein